jgi:hypothetical protein
VIRDASELLFSSFKMKVSSMLISTIFRMPMFLVIGAAIVVQAGVRAFAPVAPVWNRSVHVHVGYGSSVSYRFFLFYSAYPSAYSLNYLVSG